VDEFPIDRDMEESLIEATTEAEKIYTPDKHLPHVVSAVALGSRARSPPVELLFRNPRKKIKPEFVPITGTEFFLQKNWKSHSPQPRAITSELMKLIEDDGLYASPEEIEKFWETEQASHRAFLDMYRAFKPCPDTKYTYTHPTRKWLMSKRDETMVQELLQAGALIDRDMLEEEFYLLENCPGQENPMWFTSTAKDIMAKYDEGKKLIELATRK
jgi:hypothetical protein